MFIVSDSLGETGALVTRAALSQFTMENYDIRRFSNVNDIETLQTIMLEASDSKNSVLVYTLVDKELVSYIENYSLEKGLVAVDLLTPLIDAISKVLGIEPTREPGIIRKLDESYFKRVAAIEFAVKYDDGKDPRGLKEADVVLIGISRTSKTPLSMYLANKNIKVANIPLVIEVNAPRELFEIPAKKVIGLTNSPEKLNELRGERLRSMGLSSGSDYADLNRILDELEYAEKIMKKIGCPIIDVSNKAIEETSELVINLLKKNGIRFDD